MAKRVTLMNTVAQR